MKHSKFLALAPPFYLVISAAIFGLILHTREQTRRQWYLPLFLISAILSLTSTKYFWFSRSLMSLWDQSVTLNILHTVSLFYIEQYPAPKPPPVKAVSAVGRFRERWTWRIATTYRLWGNPQLMRVRSVAEESGQLERESKHAVQDLGTFVFLRAIKLPMYYYAHTVLMPELSYETIVEIRPFDVGAEQQKLIRRLTEFTAREAVIRGHTAISWLWESFIYLDGANAILAIFFVLIGADEPADWPPLFGRLADATTLNKFWSVFWHQIATRPYKNYGRVVADRLLALRPRTVLYNAVVALVVFGLSGATHAVVAWHGGLQDWHLEIWWFLLNFFGCSLEMAFLSCIRALAKQTGWSRQLGEIERSWFGSFVGYTWVFLFLFWSLPKWKYPRMELQAVAEENFRKFIAQLRGADFY